MEKSTVVTLLIVAGLGGFAIWWYLKGTGTALPAVQTPPPGPCSSTGEQIAGGAISAVGKYYTAGKANLTPTQTCMGLSAVAKGVAKKTSVFLADHTSTRDTLLFVPNTLVAPRSAITHPVQTGKGIYNAVGGAVGGALHTIGL